MKIIYEVILITTISKLALSKIKNGMTVSLGGGHNVFNLTQAIRHAQLDIRLCSPSELTRLNLPSNWIASWLLRGYWAYWFSFRWLRQCWLSFQRSKKWRWYHLYEKIAAQMSDKYVWLLPAERIQKELSNKVPLCIEIAPPVVKQVIKTGESMNLKMKIRKRH